MDKKTENIIKKYLLSKNSEIIDNDALKSLKESLALENGNRRLKMVENATTIEIKEMNLDDIKISAKKHYNTIEARELIAEKGSLMIAGILTSHHNHYHLLDGYHRTKFLKENTNNKTALYIILK